MDVPLSTLPLLPSGRTYKGKDNTLWYKNPARYNVRTRSENIMNSTPEVKPSAKNAKTALECFYLVVNECMLLDIMVYTNASI